MGGLSIWHWLIVLAVVLILFGGGNKMSSLMGDFAKGIKSFKKNMADDESMEAGETRPAGSIAAPTARGETRVDATRVDASRVDVNRADATVPPRETVSHG